MHPVIAVQQVSIQLGLDQRLDGSVSDRSAARSPRGDPPFTRSAGPKVSESSPPLATCPRGYRRSSPPTRHLLGDQHHKGCSGRSELDERIDAIVGERRGRRTSTSRPGPATRFGSRISRRLLPRPSTTPADAACPSSQRPLRWSPRRLGACSATVAAHLLDARHPFDLCTVAA